MRGGVQREFREMCREPPKSGQSVMRGRGEGKEREQTKKEGGDDGDEHSQWTTKIDKSAILNRQHRNTWKASKW